MFCRKLFVSSAENFAWRLLKIWSACKISLDWIVLLTFLPAVWFSCCARAKHFTGKPRTKALDSFLINEYPLGKYYKLPIAEEKILATYIWVDETGENLRSVARTLTYIPKESKDKLTRVVEDLDKKVMEEAAKDLKFSQAYKYMTPYFCPRNLENIHKVQCGFRIERNTSVFDENFKDLPTHIFDGDVTGLSVGATNEIYLVPRAIYRNPFRRGQHILVMCDTYDTTKEPTPTNHRVKCYDAYTKCQEEEPWFAIEQEFILHNCTNLKPHGWPQNGFPKPEGIYQYAVGADRIYARDLMETVYRSCLYAGIPVAGVNAEIAPSQWEYQVGPSLGVAIGDDLWISRYILERLCEEYGLILTLDPKPDVGWSGSSAHMNFSTKKMREDNGISEIEKAIEKLSKTHMRHIKAYDAHGGQDNMRRLIGEYNTGQYYSFSCGIADRCASVRIPRAVAEDKKGYMEDRRPAANCDPYLVADALMRTCLLNE